VVPTLGNFVSKCGIETALRAGAKEGAKLVASCIDFHAKLGLV
jgi:hypothetical protein